MKRRARAGLQYLLPLSAGLVTFILLSALSHSRHSADTLIRRANGNPDQFHLWTTNRSYDFAFTYDPLAADNWLFESASAAKSHAPLVLSPARLVLVSNSPPYGLLGQPAPR